MILTINGKFIMPKANTWADGVVFPGPSFRTVVIDSGGVFATQEWMAENLAIDDGGGYASEQARLERAQIPTTWGGDMQV